VRCWELGSNILDDFQSKEVLYHVVPGGVFRWANVPISIAACDSLLRRKTLRRQLIISFRSIFSQHTYFSSREGNNASFLITLSVLKLYLDGIGKIDVIDVALLHPVDGLKYILKGQ
jgi:hypothetical protein